jgi:phosphoserine aminotransferase
MVDVKDWKIDPEGSFFCFCCNETVNGFEFDFETFPLHLIPGDMPVIGDMSSSIAIKDIPYEKFGMIYMGA